MCRRANRDTSSCPTVTISAPPGACRPAAISPAARRNIPSARRPQSYVTMADGCRLAVDVFLPDGDASRRWPTVLILTPYIRRFELAPGAAASSRRPTPTAIATCSCRAATRWSWSTRAAPARPSARAIPSARPRERADYKTIADWIVAQPWSDGAIGATGISYLGAACDFLASTGPQGGQGDRAAVRRLGHLGRQLLSRRHADQAVGAGLRRADAGARP